MFQFTNTEISVFCVPASKVFRNYGIEANVDPDFLVLIVFRPELRTRDVRSKPNLTIL